MAEQTVLHVRAYEELYTVSDAAKSDWQKSLTEAKTKICQGIAQAFGVEVAEGQDPCAAIANIPRERFVEKLAEPAVAGWRDFFGVAPGTKAYNASIKMYAKLSAAAPFYGARLSEAMTTYFVDRVTKSVDKWAERMVTIRFVGDPPHTPYGPAPFIAAALTNMRVPRDYRPPHAVVQGQFGDYIAPEFKEYVRPLIIAAQVQAGVIARYLLTAGLNDVAAQYLRDFANRFGALLARLAAEGYSITYTAGFEDVEWAPTPMIYFDVTVTRSGGT